MDGITRLADRIASIAVPSLPIMAIPKADSLRI
jgi:hypothetical protein